MNIGKKRPRGSLSEIVGKQTSPAPKKKGHQNSNKKKRENSNKNTKNDLDSWVENLVKKQASNDASAVSLQTASTKAERIEKRAAKQQRRHEKLFIKHGKHHNDTNAPAPHSLVSSSVVAANAGGAKVSKNAQEQPRRKAGVTTTQSLERLKALVTFCRELEKQQNQAANGKYRQPFQGFPPMKVKKRKKWDTENIQPRPKDYGGLGLALPSLFLSLEDPSFGRLLEDEFQEHIDGFFGKLGPKP